jgi:hypothetical protein
VLGLAMIVSLDRVMMNPAASSDVDRYGLVHRC